MKFKQFKSYFGVFALAVAIIAVYKTFDNIGDIIDGVKSFFSMLMPVVIAFGIAFLMYPLCKKAEIFIKAKMPEFFAKRALGLSVLVSYISVAIFIALLFYLLLPTIAESLLEFIGNTPTLVDKMITMINDSGYFKVERESVFAYINQYLSENLLTDLDTYTSKITSFSEGLISFILSLITSIYILLDRKSMLALFRRIADMFFVQKKQNFAKRYIKDAINFTYKYSYCVIVDAIIVFVISLIILSIMGIDHTPVLALMIGIFNIVPYFGAICACIIAVLITILTANLSTGIILAVILLILQQIDANVIQPHLIKESLNVKPFWVLVGIFVGGGLFGIWGIILAVPVLALIRTMILDYFEYREGKFDTEQADEKKAE